MGGLFRSRVCALVFTAQSIMAAGVSGQGIVTLDQIYNQLRSSSPQFAAAVALADAARLRKSAAGLPSDPLVQLGFMNLSLPQLRADMPSSMAPSIQLMQMVPFPGKLSLAGRIAEKDTKAAELQAAELLWELRARAAMSFYEIYSIDAQVEVMIGTLALLENFAGVAKALYAAGTGRQSDVLRANVETARMRADLHRMRAMRSAASARLNGLLNRPAETAIGRVKVGVLPAEAPDLVTLRASADSTRPMLSRGQALLEKATLQRSLAGKELWPDVTVGIGYGQRAAEDGIERMASVMMGASLPVFAARKQLRMRDEATAMVNMAHAELAVMRSQVAARIQELSAILERNAGLIELYRAEILPQAEANVQSALSSYRVGSVDFMTLLDAQMTVANHQKELHGLIAEHGIAVAELEMTIGRVIPVTRPLPVEIP